MWMTGETDVGQKRKNNQDTFLTEQLSGGCGLLLVCDGMGGAAAGKLASEIAVRTYMEALGETLTEGMDLDAVQSAMAESGAGRSPADWRFPPRQKACAARSVLG